MEQTLPLVIHGIKLARDLELELPHLSTQPMVLYNACDELTRVFKSAMDRLSSTGSSSSFPQMNIHESLVGPQASSELALAVQGWLRSSSTQTRDLLHAPLPTDTNMVRTERKILELGGMDIDYKENVEGLSRSKSATEFPTPEGSGRGKNPVVHRSRKRKGGADKRTETVPAPRMGNTDIPPEDGYTWRKYGQKEILGSAFPRGYFRCTHKNFYGCQAKKQVQRLDEDPNMFQVTYYGQHTCHNSPTAPSAHVIGHENLQPPSFSHPLMTWLSTETMFTTSFGGSGSSSRAAGGPSHASQNTKEAEFPVLDLADVMFNSGSSSNSMDSIFPPPPREDK